MLIARILVLALGLPALAQAAPALNVAQIDALVAKVAAWQMASPGTHRMTHWTQGALFSGLMRYASFQGPGSAAERYLMAVGEKEGWALGPKKFFADDDCVGQTWIDLYRIHRRPEMIAETVEVMDEFVANRDPQGDMAHVPANSSQRWTWCDALFMAPPVLAKLYAMTGDAKYHVTLLAEYKRTVDLLFDKEEKLFYRDDRNIPRREANGQKMFWSRGNGWVLAGLANLLQELPKKAPARPYFEDLFRQLAGRLKAIQQPDGSWHASLLDPASYPVAETSGTAFFTYGLAWGITHGLLDRAEYEPAVVKGWKVLAAAVEHDGKLGFVQPIGQDPRTVTRDMTEVYGVGGFLLAGVEVRKLALRVAGRHVPERKDDFAWENDRVAFRAYGPALQATGEISSGLDVWCKSVAHPVVDRWYFMDDYHADHGEGLDMYKVGPGRGCGGTAIWADGKLVASKNWTAYRFVTQKADKLVFELDYAPWQAGAATVTETKRITLAAGTSFNRIESRFAVKGAPKATLAIGVQRHEGLNGQANLDARRRVIALWEQAPDATLGHIATGVKLLGRRAKVREAEGHLLLLTDIRDGDTVTYQAGAIWSRHPAAPRSSEAWFTAVGK